MRIDLANPSNPVFRYLSTLDDPGGGIWSTPAIDEAANTVFVTTGTGDQDADNGLWGAALLALDATTLEIKAYFFMPLEPDDGDIEWGSSPTLYETPDGSRWVAATGKDGGAGTVGAGDPTVSVTVLVAAAGDGGALLDAGCAVGCAVGCTAPPAATTSPCSPGLRAAGWDDATGPRRVGCRATDVPTARTARPSAGTSPCSLALPHAGCTASAAAAPFLRR